MWAQVENDLHSLLGKRIYGPLLTDPVYRKFLDFAGFDAPFPADLRTVSPASRENLAKAAGMHAHIAVQEIAQSGALEESTCCAKLIAGPVILYRFWNSGDPARRVSVWWLQASVMADCKLHAGKSLDRRKAWLREHLAVCLDWSKMDRLDTLSLPTGAEIPAIEGTGAPMRVYSAGALPGGKVASADYWPNLGKYYPGGVKQIILPFIPPSRGLDLNRFLSQS